MRRLSQQQQHMLVYIYHTLQAGAPPAEAPPMAPWGTDGPPTFRASTSRSLRHLERQGLIHRLHYKAGKARASPQAAQHRTTHVTLTPAGLALAQRLTSPVVVGC